MTDIDRRADEQRDRLRALRPVRVLPLPLIPTSGGRRTPTSLTAFRLTTRETNTHG